MVCCGWLEGGGDRGKLKAVAGRGVKTRYRSVADEVRPAPEGAGRCGGCRTDRYS